MYTNYSRYKEIKDSFNVSYRGYDMKSIMSLYFVFISYKFWKTPIDWRSIKNNLCYGVNFDNAKNDIASEDIILFTLFDYRFDYVKYVNNVVSTVENSVLMPNLNSDIFRFNLFSVFVSFFQVFLFNFKEGSINFRERFYYFLKLVYFKNSIDNLESQIKSVGIKKHVTFMSVESRSSILCQFFSKKGVLNYGMQHGLHLPANYYSRDIPLDVFNIENFQADFFLAWGNCMKEIFQKGGISEERVLIAGNPNYGEIHNLQINNGPLHRILLCLGRNIYTEENILLLELAGKLYDSGVSVAIKLHPYDDWSSYNAVIANRVIEKLPIDMGVKESVEYFNPDYVIVVNSTVYYEYLMCGVFAFRFGDSQDLPIGFLGKVYDLDSFLFLLNEVQSIDSIDLKIEIERLLKYVFTLGENHYNQILNHD